MPGFRVYRSNRIEALAEVLAEELRLLPLADPFAALQIVVGSRGMERWLRHRLALRLGVCAGVEFPFPEAMLDSILDGILGEPGGGGPGKEPPEDGEAGMPDPWSPAVLTWAILGALPGLLGRPGFEMLRAYLAVEDGGAPAPAGGTGLPVIPAREHALAVQLGDLFDRYVTYRPQMAIDWSIGIPSGVSGQDAAFAWQPVLWDELRRRLLDAPHRASKIARAKELLDQGRAARLPVDPVRIFGVSALPPVWLDLLAGLGRVADVELYLLCPSGEYWADLGSRVRGRAEYRSLDRDRLAEVLLLPLPDDGKTEDGHPLLASLGRVARDFQVILETGAGGYRDERTDLFLLPENDVAGLRPGGAPSALSRLQQDILYDRAPLAQADPAARLLLPEDDSIAIHACHGPTRQVEVLREALLGLLDDHPEIEPRDIVVMTPDIAAFAPLVSAVFGPGSRKGMDGDAGKGRWGAAGAPDLPFEIADLSVRRLNPVADVLLRVLRMATGRVEASALVDLLQIEPLRLRFGLEASDLPILEGWIRDSGIRWGLDAGHRESCALPGDPQNTWRFGLERLLLGVVAADEGDLYWGGVRPFDAMEGDGTRLLGRFVDLVAQLFSELADLSLPRPVQAWAPRLRVCADRLCATTPEAKWLSQRVREELEALGREATRAGCTRPVGQAAILSALEGRFEVASASSRQQSGAITFCAMVPMRSVPYDVVCLLGMDEGAFPRKGGSLAFDLCARSPRAGDREPRDEDRHLLLEALLSARRHLLVLYTGRDDRTNEERAPAVPVAELFDSIDGRFDVAGAVPGGRAPRASKWLRTEHALQGFSFRNFLPDRRNPRDPEAPRPWSFDRRLLDGALALAARTQDVPPFFDPERAVQAVEPSVDLSIGDLVGFLRRPIRTLLQRRLKVNLYDGGAATSDREPVALDELAGWQIKDEILGARLAGRSAAQAERELRAAGLLPLGYAGKAAAQMPAAIVEAMLGGLGLLAGDGQIRPTDAPVPVDLDLGKARLHGTVDGIFDGFAVELAFGNLAVRKLLGAWVRLLAWEAMRPASHLAIVALGQVAGGKPKVDMRGLAAPEDPVRVLRALADLHLLGSRQPIPLLGEASWVFVTGLAELIRGEDATDPGLGERLLADPDAAEATGKALDRAIAAWEGGIGHPGESAEPHAARVFEGRVPMIAGDPRAPSVDPDFARCSLLAFGPLQQALLPKKTVESWLEEGSP